MSFEDQPKNNCYWSMKTPFLLFHRNKPILKNVEKNTKHMEIQASNIIKTHAANNASNKSNT